MSDRFLCITSFEFIFNELDVVLTEGIVEDLKSHLKRSVIRQGQWGMSWHEGIPSIFVDCEFEPVFLLTEQFKPMMDDAFNVSKFCIEKANNILKSNIIFRGVGATFHENEYIYDDIEGIFNIKLD